jgi:hypothetical protein
MSFDAFRALGVPPSLGRAYTAKRILRTKASVIVLGHEFWQERWVDAPTVLDRRSRPTASAAR